MPPPDCVALPWGNVICDPYWWRHSGYVEECPPRPRAVMCSHAVPMAECEPCRFQSPRLTGYEVPVEQAAYYVNPLVGQTVLARRVEDGHFYLGKAEREVSRDRFLVIFDQSCPGHGCTRNVTFQEVWIYDIISFADAFRHPIEPGDKVLVHVGGNLYSPASVFQGSEQRSSNICLKTTDLIVNHIGGNVEKVGQGMSIWIPPAFFDRLVFELKLPHNTRMSLCNRRNPETTFVCTGESDCYPVEDQAVCDEECPHVVSSNPYQCDNYCKALYKSWPWWWKYWYDHVPPPCEAEKEYVVNYPQTPPVTMAMPPPPRPAPPVPANVSPPRTRPHAFRPKQHGLAPLSRSQSAVNFGSASHFYDEGLGECYEVPYIENDPLSRKVADQITEHSRMVLGQKRCEATPQPTESSQDNATQTPPVSIQRKWRPQKRWIPVNKNRYGANKPMPSNYVQQDRGHVEWQERGQSAAFARNYSYSDYYGPGPAVAHQHCHCGHGDNYYGYES